MLIIKLNVQSQTLTKEGEYAAAEKTLNYVRCVFQFSEEWDGTVKTAYFRNPKTRKIYSQLLDEENTCVVPWEALTDAGYVYLSVAGERDGYRITSSTEAFKNRETIYGGKPSDPPTPDQYDQMLEIMRETKEAAKGKADGLRLDGSRLQLTAGEETVGEPVTLPSGGGAGAESITNQEIDQIMEEQGKER